MGAYMIVSITNKPYNNCNNSDS